MAAGAFLDTCWRVLFVFVFLVMGFAGVSGGESVAVKRNNSLSGLHDNSCVGPFK